MLNINKKTAIVTGGGRGIGEAIVEQLANEGVTVFIWETNRVSDAYNHYESKDIMGFDAALDVEKRLTQKGLKVVAKEVNVLCDDAVTNELDQMFSDGLSPQFLVNALGSSQAQLTVDTTTPQINSILGINLVAPFIACRELAKRLIKHELNGSFVNIGSIAGKSPYTHVSAYSAAKAGLAAFSTSLAVELAEYQIQVNTVCPGIVKTNMWKYLRTALDEGNETDEIFWSRMAEMIPQKRFQTGEAVAELVSFVLKNDQITGQSFSIDGGINRHA